MRQPLRTLIFWIASFCAVIAAARAQDAALSPVTAEARLDTAAAAPGATVTFTILVQHDRDIAPQPPDLTDYFKDFDLLETAHETRPDKDGQTVQALIYKLRARSGGVYTFAPIAIKFTVPGPRNSGQSIAGEILTQEIQLEVSSQPPAPVPPDETIRDIKPLAELPPDYGRNALRALLALAAITLLFWLWRKHRRTGKPLAPAFTRPLTPQEAALQALAALRGQNLLAQNKIREHYFALSDIFRRYLAARFGFPALDWTTEEIKNCLGQRYIMELPAQRAALAILEYSDLVKFASILPADCAANPVMESIAAFIAATPSVPAPAAGSPATSTAPERNPRSGRL